MFEMSMNAEVEDVIDLFVKHGFGQAKRRDLAEHKSAALVLLVKQMDLVAKRGQISCDCQRSRAGSDQRDLLAVRVERPLRHQVFDLALVVGGDAL